jgi:hypothetical protein
VLAADREAAPAVLVLDHVVDQDHGGAAALQHGRQAAHPLGDRHVVALGDVVEGEGAGKPVEHGEAGLVLVEKALDLGLPLCGERFVRDHVVEPLLDRLVGDAEGAQAGDQHARVLIVEVDVEHVFFCSHLRRARGRQGLARRLRRRGASRQEPVRGDRTLSLTRPPGTGADARRDHRLPAAR